MGSSIINIEYSEQKKKKMISSMNEIIYSYNFEKSVF